MPFASVFFGSPYELLSIVFSNRFSLSLCPWLLCVFKIDRVVEVRRRRVSLGTLFSLVWANLALSTDIDQPLLTLDFKRHTWYCTNAIDVAWGRPARLIWVCLPGRNHPIAFLNIQRPARSEKARPPRPSAPSAMETRSSPSMGELRAVAHERGLKYYMHLSKPELFSLLQRKEGGGSSKPAAATPTEDAKEDAKEDVVRRVETAATRSSERLSSRQQKRKTREDDKLDAPQDKKKAKVVINTRPHHAHGAGPAHGAYAQDARG